MSSNKLIIDIKRYSSMFFNGALVTCTLLLLAACGGTVSSPSSSQPTPGTSAVTETSIATATDGMATFQNITVQVTDLVSEQSLSGIEVTLIQQGSQNGIIALDPQGQYVTSIFLTGTPSATGGIRHGYSAKPQDNTATVPISLTNIQYLTNANSTTPVSLTGSMWSSLESLFYSCSAGPLSNVDGILAQEAQDALTTDQLEPTAEVDVVMILDVVAPEVVTPVAAVLLVRQIASLAAEGSNSAALAYFQAKGYLPTDQFQICQVKGVAAFFLDHGFTLHPLQNPSGQSALGSSVSGKIYDANTGLALPGSTVELAGPTSQTILADANGSFNFSNPIAITSTAYSLSASRLGYLPGGTQFTLTSGQAYTVNIGLTKSTIPVRVSVLPTTAQVAVNGTQPFTANVTGTSDTAVTWTVNGVNGGNATVGTVTTLGLYSAPALVPIPPTVTVTATSQANTNASASASVRVIGTTTAPTVTTSSPASLVTSNSATLPGTVNPNGSDTNVWFQYSVSSSMRGATTTPQNDIGAGTTTVPFSANIAGLTANTTYYYQEVASNSVGTSMGAILSFTTPASAQAPTVTTGPASAVTSNSATLGGTVNPNGSDTHIWFQYSTNSSMSGATTTPQNDIGAGTTTVPFSANIAGLTASTTYYYQEVASNIAGTSTGAILSFITASSGPILSTFTISPSTISSGQLTTLTFGLSGTTSGTATISLSSSNPSAFPVPPTVNIQAGQSSTSFSDEAGTVTTTTTVTVTATYNGTSLQAQVTVNPISPTVNSVAPNPVIASNSDQPIGIFGSNFQNGDTLTFIDTLGQPHQSVPSKLTFVSSSQIDYEFNDNSDIGTWTVTVNSADNSEHSLPFSFLVAEFTIGENVMVSGTGGAGLNLRACAALSCTSLVDMPDGTVMGVIGGPTAADGHTWWELSGPVGGTSYTGWAVQDYLVPD